MQILNRCLLNIYRRMKKIDEEALNQVNRQKCKCGKNVVFYETTKIIDETDRDVAITIGTKTHIRGELYAFGKCGKIEIGRECYVGVNTFIWSTKQIKIGDRVLIGHNCNIFDNDTHPKNSKERNRQYRHIIHYGHPRNINLNEKRIVIENDVWIGANCTILKGVKIGKGSIIGTGTIVTRNIPSNSIVYGNPLIIHENNEEDK